MALKEKSIARFFRRYLVLLILLLFGLVIAMMVLFNIGINMGIFLPAYTVEKQISALKTTLEQHPEQAFDPSALSAAADYAVFDKNGNCLDTDMDEKELKAVKETSYINGNTIHTVIERPDTTIVLRYKMQAQYGSDRLNHLLPNPEILTLFIFGGIYILAAVLLSRHYANRVKRELKPLTEAAASIANNNLEFESRPSTVKEFNQVLDAFNTMRQSLKNSLETQWQAEKRQQEEIGALAHDIKTPLTIISGNAELLMETEKKDIKESADYIYENCRMIENYVEVLLMAARDQESLMLNDAPIDTKTFAAHLESQIQGYLAKRPVRVIFRQEKLPQILWGDQLFLTRALMNILTNGADYTPDGNTLFIEMIGTEDRLIITVTDGGKGFSEKALKHASEKFFREDASRHSRKHHGMGLYIANQITRAHGGNLTIANAKEKGRGGVVSLTLPINLSTQNTFFQKESHIENH